MATKKAAKKKPVKKAAKKKAVNKSAKKKTVKKAAKKTVKRSVAKKAAKKAKKSAAPGKKAANTKSASATKPKPVKKPVAKTGGGKFVPHSTSLRAGDKAPAFSGISQDGLEVSLEALKGRKVVLYFYPKDDTPGCTAEACSLRDNYDAMLRAGYSVVGVSADNQKSHEKFARKYNLPFPLLADTDHSIIKSYDVWGKKQFMGRVFEGIIRTTFVIDENGVIADVITQVDTANHAEQILR